MVKQRKIINELNKHHINAISAWFRAMKKCPDFRSDIKLIKKYHKSIGKHINKYYSNIGTRRNHLSVLGVVLNYLEHPKLAEIYLQQADKLNREVDEATKKQDMSEREKESWMSHSDLLKFQKQLKKEYEKDKSKIKNCYNHLVISWYIMRPPTRLEPGDMEIITKESDIKPNKNYLLKHNNSKYELIIQKDKVSKTQGTLRDIVAPNLSMIITDSLTHFPRKYFITQLRNTEKPMKESGLSKFISRMYCKGLTLGMLRSSYISWIYEQKDDNITTRELARLCRHSIETARNSYRKYNNSETISLVDDHEG